MRAVLVSEARGRRCRHPSLAEMFALWNCNYKQLCKHAACIPVPDDDY